MSHFNRLSIVPSVIAHRGAKAFAPENTLAAFKRAKELGFSWVEFDVMLSADNELVVIHDEELRRTTNGRGAVIDYPYAHLQTLDAGAWFDPAFAQETIPTLQAVLTLLSQKGLSANIEIKALQGRDEIIVEKVLTLLAQQENKNMRQYLLSSFSHNVLQLLRQYSAACPLGFLMDEWLDDWEQYCDQWDCMTINVNHAILTPERIATLKASGRQVLTYTVNKRARAQELYAWGVDAIFSDCPLEIVEMIRGR